MSHWRGTSLGFVGDVMAKPMVIKSKNGLTFKLHPLLGSGLGDWKVDPETNTMKMVPFPSDIADIDPMGAVKLAQELGYTQDEEGAWCDPVLSMDLTSPTQTE